MYANESFSRLTGYSTEEVIGRTPQSLYGIGTEQIWSEEVHDALVNRTSIRLEALCRRKDGTRFWNKLSVSPVRDETGTVTHFAWIQRDTTARREREARLVRHALHDLLTGLPNRTLFAEFFKLGLMRSDRRGNRAAILFVDLDDFKSINDSFGHEVGDRVLVAVARRLDRCLRIGDSAARLGGDEFAVFLESVAGANEATEVAERIAEALRTPFQVLDQELSVSASVGVTLVTDPDRESLEGLLSAADVAMYRAKRAGGDRCAVSDSVARDRPDPHGFGRRIGVYYPEASDISKPEKRTAPYQNQ